MEENSQNRIKDATSSDNKVGIITMHEFLDFLKITCQVNESIDSNSEKRIDYNDLAKNELVNSLLNRANKSKTPIDKTGDGIIIPMDNTSPLLRKEKCMRRRHSRKSKDSDTRPNLDPALNEKLDEVINEGILDSVLPFICPPVAASTSSITHFCTSKPKIISSAYQNLGKSNNINDLINKSQENLSGGRKTDSNITLSSTFSGKDKNFRRKSMQSANVTNDFDVVIHVCDEVKGVSRDFTCQQKLLVAKMGYFADVTSGQRLEDMDISVHCDLQIFEWLMKWVKRDNVSPEMWPLLDPSNVVPILVSASFLQMEPLLLDCLSFCHAHLNEVVKASANLSCLNDNIISRLAAMFTNLELEMVKDKKERVTPRLWTKLIQSLCEPEPQSLRGHYASLSDLYKCTKCSKYVTQSVNSYIHCLPQNMKLNRWGQIISHHTRDPSWSITQYVASLHKELKSWRKVYWRLWGNCHFLYCASCEMHFPLCQMNWCLYHPDQPQFLGPVTEGRMAGPTGRYPCCGQQAFRYETLPGPSGCQYREHTIQIDSDRDRAILRLAQLADEGGCLYQIPPTPVISSFSSNEPWWNGISLTPHRDRQGLLPAFTVEETRTRKKLPPKPAPMLDSSSETESSDHKRYPVFKQYSTSSDGCESDYSSPRPRKYRQKHSKRKNKTTGGRYWSGEVSARSNQDFQREFEEKAMKQVIAMVGKKTGSDMNVQYQNYYQGGTYVRLENEWRENMKHKHGSVKAKNK